MAIANLKPTVKLPDSQVDTITGEPKTYKSVVYDDMTQVPVSSLLAYIEGYPWTVTYYSQVTSDHSELREIDAALPSIYQPHRKINNLEIKVNSTLSSNFNQQYNFTDVTGTATLYSYLIPNKGDYFTTEAGQNQFGLYLVTSVTRKTFNRDSVYEIEYELKGYQDTSKDQIEALEKSVVREYYFSKDRLIEGLSPILKTEDFNLVTDVKQIYRELVQFYFDTFYNRELASICIPGQDASIYDHYVVNFLYKIVDVSEHDFMLRSTQYGRQQDTYMAQIQFWDILLNKLYKRINYANKEMELLSRKYFNISPWLGSMRYSNFDYVLYPVDPDTSIQIAHKYPRVKLRAVSKRLHPTTPNTNVSDTKDVAKKIWGEPAYFDWYEDDYYFYPYTCPCGDNECMFTDYFSSLQGKDIPLIHPVLADNYYVLSEQFYKNGKYMSKLEILTRDYSSNKTIDKDIFLKLANDYHAWPRLEQFYYVPILIVIAKELVRSIYS